jgi:subtilisin
MKLMRLLGVIMIGAATSLAWGQIIPGQYLAVFDDRVTDHPSEVRAAAAQHGLAVGHVYQHALKGFAFAGSPQAAAALARRPGIAYVEPDQVAHAWAQTLPTGIDRVDVDVTGIIDGIDDALDVDIAIIDTGIDTSHTDLRVAGGVRYYTQGPRLRWDNNYNDDNGHGTHVAGTAAAIDNGDGVVGVAPGARLWAVKVLGSNGSGSLSAVIAGIDWVTAYASTIEVANMSLGSGKSQAVNDAVRKGTEKGVVFVVSAGNDGADASLYSPASEPTAITVSALADSDGEPGGTGSSFVYSDGSLYTADDTFAPFSNYGSVVDICAPGVLILSTVPVNSYDGSYSGTSMASPHVAGAAALYVARNGLTKTSAGVAAVAKALKDSGWQFGEAGYLLGGDPDGIREPLLNVGRLIGGGGTQNTQPTVTITGPENGDTFDYNATITFSGTASDTEDGDLTGSLSWTSDINGPIGSGGSFSTVLSPGTHIITASVIDSGGLTGVDSITITVNDDTEPPPPSGITLTATGYKVRGRQHVDLKWSGAAGETVTVNRNTLQITTPNDGAYTDAIGAIGGGTYVYQVVDANGNKSNTATVTF